MATGDQIVTASWDRTANVYDAATGELLQSLVGKLMITYLEMNL